MEDKFAENLVLLIHFAKRIEIACGEMHKVCTDLLESSQVAVSTLSPEDYE